MPKEYSSLSGLLDHGFDAVIDVRSPAEFAEDHIPGAINLPVLSNEERAEVGTVYVQQSPFLARKIGAALVFRNAARHIEDSLQQFDGSWRPLVYCWRGGQRSGSFGWVLAQIGWRSDVVTGGYQTYRRLVYRYLYQDPLPHRFIALDGYTGTAKTDLLHVLQARGVQVLDLEGLANHRGSLLGMMDTPQPSQKGFETSIAVALNALDPARPVLVEAESSKIGKRIIPPGLWSAMKQAPRIEVAAPIAARTAYLVKAYDDILSDATTLENRLNYLRPYRGHAVVDGWLDLIGSGDKPGLTQALMEQHYDPAYDKSRKTNSAAQAIRVVATALDTGGLNETAGQIEAAIMKLDQVLANET